MKRLLFIILAGYCFFVAPAYAEDKALPRTILAVYDGSIEGNIQFTKIHRYLEMELNQLGFDVKYVNVQDPLPALTDDIYGIVVWIDTDTRLSMNYPDPYLNWLSSALDRKMKLVVLEGLGIAAPIYESPEGLQKINKLLRRLGVEETGIWDKLMYKAKILRSDPRMMEFEQKFGDVLPSHMRIRKFGRDSVSYFTVQNDESDNSISDMVITSPSGGYVSDGYALNYNDAFTSQKWYINPFRFLSIALDTDDLPKPDTTTLMGRRIFYSHIDGDGWNNLTQIEKDHDAGLLASEIVLRDVFEAYPDLPFTMGYVVADLDTSCYGVKGGLDVAKKMAALPNVEPSSHTFSHPLYWGFFADNDPSKEKPFLDLYPPQPGQSKHSLMRWLGDDKKSKNWENKTLATDIHKMPAPAARTQRDVRLGATIDAAAVREQYDLPRSYACAPFDLNQEISGARDFINAFSPPEKKVHLLQWSGDTSPFEGALAAAREAGLYNINGGDSRFDSEYPSYTWVPGIGLEVGDERQIYSSNSNENTYTFLWTKRFYGYRYLRATVENTETPIRIKPFNLYFHIYSGEKAASIAAVRENLDYARTLDIIPITATRYSSIAGSFYSTRYISLGQHSWRVINRGTMQTVRFDKASLLAVDFTRSKGVIGQKYFQGSLYVSLDAGVAEPIITLTDNFKFGTYPDAKQPYMVDSSWNIASYSNTKDSGLSFAAQGYGNGRMTWKLQESGNFIVEVKKGENSLYKAKENVTNSKFLLLNINISAIDPVTVTITPTAK